MCLHFLYSTLLGLLGTMTWTTFKFEIDLISSSIDFTRRVKFCSPHERRSTGITILTLYFHLILVHLGDTTFCPDSSIL